MIVNTSNATSSTAHLITTNIKSDDDGSFDTLVKKDNTIIYEQICNSLYYNPEKVCDVISELKQHLDNEKSDPSPATIENLYTLFNLIHDLDKIEYNKLVLLLLNKELKKEYGPVTCNSILGQSYENSNFEFKLEDKVSSDLVKLKNVTDRPALLRAIDIRLAADIDILNEDVYVLHNTLESISKSFGGNLKTLPNSCKNVCAIICKILEIEQNNEKGLERLIKLLFKKQDEIIDLSYFSFPTTPAISKLFIQLLVKFYPNAKTIIYPDTLFKGTTSELSNLANLTKLDLSQVMYIDDDDWDNIVSLTKLQILSVRGRLDKKESKEDPNDIETITRISYYVKQLKDLTHLTVSHIKVTRNFYQTIQSMKQLQELRIGYSDIPFGIESDMIDELKISLKIRPFSTDRRHDYDYYRSDFLKQYV